MPPDRHLPNEFRGIRRSQQASLNCRRKKAKCSGERPVCGYCKRLGQDCQWEKPGRGKEADSDGPAASEIGYLSTRVAVVEGKLDDLHQLLSTHLAGLASRNNNTPRPTTQIGPNSPITSSAGRSNYANDIDAASQPNAVQTELYKQLPPSGVLAALVDTYFLHVHNQPYSFFHERTFRQRLAARSLPDFLVYAVMASALRFSNDSYYGDTVNDAIKSYASESWKQIVLVWFGPESDPDINICQAVTLLSIIDFTAGRRHPGWLKIGLAIRVAQDFRLMMEPSESLEFSGQEERRRIFWSIYILDKLCSCGRARPSALADVHCVVQLPCDETTFRNGEWKKTPTLEQAFSSTDSITEGVSDLGLLVLTASVLGRCAQHSIHFSGKHRLPPWNSDSVFATIYSILLQLETKFELGNGVKYIIEERCMPGGVLDMQLAGSVILSRAIFRTCQCLLHHPLLVYQQSRVTGTKVPPTFWNRALQTCRENACSISELIQEITSSGCPAFLSFMGYCATVAASVHSLYLCDDDVSIQQKASEYLHIDKLFLEALSHRWKSGERMLEVLDNINAKPSSSGLSSLVSAIPDWKSFDSEQMENIWATLDYNTMSEGPKGSPRPQTTISHAAWDIFAGLEASPSSTVPLHQHPHNAGFQGLNMPYDTMAFAGLSPFTSFFDGGGVNFGG